jgi:glutaredoxin 3
MRLLLKGGKSMKIKVYGTALCLQCHSAKQYLKQKGISFEYVDVSKDTQAMKELEELGAMSLPVIKCGNNTIIGFNIKMLEEIINNGND